MGSALGHLRQDATRAFSAAVAAVQPGPLIRRCLSVEGESVKVLGEPVPRVTGRRVVVALGKAAPGLAAAWLECLPGWTSELFVLAPHGVPVPEEVERSASVHRGAHPIPDRAGEAATVRLLQMARSLASGDLLVVLLSGGASALLAAPVDGLTLEDLRETTRALLLAGAPVTAVNTVRRELQEAAGGGLLAAASSARVVTLILSDVPGDRVADIASGPTVRSPTGPEDALRELGRLALADAVPAAVIRTLEARTGSAGRRGCQGGAGSGARLLGSNRTAVDAAAAQLEECGYRVVTLGRAVRGEAADLGRRLGGLARALDGGSAVAVVCGGESTVTVRGRGCGGRNQELALAAAIELEGAAPCVVLAAGTDGVDGMSAHAGAIVDPTSAPRLRAEGLDPLRALEDNDSASVLGRVGDALVTGPTGTNVSDVVIVAARP